MARPLEDGGDPDVALLRARARAAREQAEARRSRVRADLAEGKVIALEDARAQIAGLALAIRRALDMAPSYLSSDLAPDVREAAAAAMAKAIHQAMMRIDAHGKT